MSLNFESTNVIVNFLPQWVNDTSLYAMFVTIGPVQSCKVMKDTKTGYSYGYGFVNFLSEETAKQAIERLNGFEIGEKRIKVSYARPPSAELRNTNLYVTNFPRSYSEDQAKTLFSQFGTIIRMTLLKDKHTKNPTGALLVRFSTTTEAEAAMSGLNGKGLENGPLCVRVAKKLGEKRAAYYLGFTSAISYLQRASRNLPYRNYFQPRHSSVPPRPCQVSGNTVWYPLSQHGTSQEHTAQNGQNQSTSCHLYKPY